MFDGRTLECWESVDGTVVAQPLYDFPPTFVHRLTFCDGAHCVDRMSYEQACQNIPEGEYSHKILTIQSGVSRLEYAPYRPCPYPSDTKLFAHLYHKDENKVWAISECGGYAFMSNANTKYQLVCCQLDKQKTIQQRIEEKKAKGYQESHSYDRFESISRQLT